MKPYQHFWGMTAILSALLLGNLLVNRTNAQPPASVPDVVTAREFRLVDKSNRVLATLSVGEDNGPQIQMFDLYGKKQMELRVSGESETDYRRPSITLFDAAERVRLRLAQKQWKGDDQAPQIQLFDGDDKLLGNFGINENRKADFYLGGIEGNSMILKPDSLFFQLPNNSTTTALFAYKANSPGLAFADQNGKYIWTAPHKSKPRR